MDSKTSTIEIDGVYKHLDSIDLSNEFDLFNSRPKLELNILAEFLGYIENKYPYTTHYISNISDLLDINDFARYIENNYSCFKINSYDITVYNIIKE